MKSLNQGLLAEFSAPDDLLAAVKRAREEGFTRFETFAPYPVEGLEEAASRKPSSTCSGASIPTGSRTPSGSRSSSTTSAC